MTKKQARIKRGFVSASIMKSIHYKNGDFDAMSDAEHKAEHFLEAARNENMNIADMIAMVDKVKNLPARYI